MRFVSVAGVLLVGLVSFGLPARTPAQEGTVSDVGTLDQATAERTFPDRRPYSPYAGRNFPTRPLFGDTHLHTMFSFDAGAFGARLSPADAYRFAKGEEVIASSGQPAKLSRPLDFLVVADHSDNMGFFPDLLGRQVQSCWPTRTGRSWYDMIQAGQGAAAAVRIIVAFSQGSFPDELHVLRRTRDAYRSAWQETIKAAEEANEPGRFTAFIGYEWTSNTGGNNLHRNVIFRDGGDKASQIVPVHADRPLAATIRATSGSGWRPTRTRPAATCSPSRTTAICRTASCSR